MPCNVQSSSDVLVKREVFAALEYAFDAREQAFLEESFLEVAVVAPLNILIINEKG